MNKRVNVFLGIAVSIISMIAVFVLFAPFAYDATFGDNPGGSEFGSVFQAMFYGYSSKVDSKSCVILLIVGFGLECLAFILGFICCGFSGKKAIVPFGLTALVLVAAGVIFVLGITFYTSVNPLPSDYHNLSLGSGSICTVVFAWLAGLLAFYGAYSSAK